VINFRYHVVSIVAVFLALAIGIVLGSTELRGTAIDALTKTSDNLRNDLNSKTAQVSALQQQVNADQAFAQASEGRLLSGLLAGQRVVLVSAPGAPGSVVTGITSALRLAGATVTGQVSLQPKLLDASQSNQQFLITLAQQLAPAGSLPANGTGLEQAAKLLGSAILTKNAAGTSGTGAGSTSTSTTGSTSGGKPAATGQAVLSSYAAAGLISGQPSVPATMAMVVAPASPSASTSDPATEGLVTLTQQLNLAGLGTVMVSSTSGSAPGSAIDALRSGSAGGQISSVDNADTTTGQIVAVWALWRALTGHKAGSYGVAQGNTAAVPSPAPSPSGSASTSASGSSPGTGGSGKKSSRGKG
jgi:Copper transport outer membrane protein, MctB